jgi:hypothetical protein
MLTGQVDQSGGDMCYHCKGDTWHTRTTCMTGMDTWQVVDRVTAHLLVDDVACFRPMAWHHVAQTWVSTWHPLVGLKFLVQNFVGVLGIRTRDLPPSRVFSKAGH